MTPGCVWAGGAAVEVVVAGKLVVVLVLGAAVPVVEPPPIVDVGIVAVLVSAVFTTQ